MDENLSFDLSAAAWRHAVGDEKAYVHALAVRLEQALPNLTRIERQRSWFSKEDTIRSIEVTFDEVVFRLGFDKRTGIHAEKSKVVRGIRLKTDLVDFSTWIDDLSRELSEYAALHQQARDVMERFLLS